MNRSILVPLDGLAESEEILAEVRRFADPQDEIHLLHVVPPLNAPVGLEPTHVIGLYDQASAFLADVRARRLPGRRGLDLVRAGKPAEGILGEALERNIHLIAMATHGRGAFNRLLLGSVASEVVRKTQLPVLLTRPGLIRSSKPIERILVTVEGRETPKELLDTVKSLAAGTKIEIILFHAISPVTDPAPVWAPSMNLTSLPAPERRLQELADLLEEEGYVAWPVVSVGSPAEEILAQGARLDVDLIALATHARSGVERLLEGSVAEAVLRRSPVPVLLQKPLVIPHPVLQGKSHE
ncbi:MAG: universal stress protein [Planctomycetes bacterium]|nr:universal stress protein [Planctomycetota bacterium]